MLSDYFNPLSRESSLPELEFSSIDVRGKKLMHLSLVHSKLRFISQLYLDNNLLQSLYGIQQFMNLEVLHFNFNYVNESQDLAEIRNKFLLKSLSFIGNPIETLFPDLNSLRSVHGNQFSSLTHLNQIKQIGHVSKTAVKEAVEKLNYSHPFQRPFKKQPLYKTVLSSEVAIKSRGKVADKGSIPRKSRCINNADKSMTSTPQPGSKQFERNSLPESRDTTQPQTSQKMARFSKAPLIYNSAKHKNSISTRRSLYSFDNSNDGLYTHRFGGIPDSDSRNFRHRESHDQRSNGKFYQQRTISPFIVYPENKDEHQDERQDERYDTVENEGSEDGPQHALSQRKYAVAKAFYYRSLITKAFQSMQYQSKFEGMDYFHPQEVCQQKRVFLGQARCSRVMSERERLLRWAWVQLRLFSVRAALEEKYRNYERN